MMMPTESLLDDGPLAAAAATGLSSRFRLWRGPDGRRQVYSVYAATEAPDYPGAVALAVRREKDRCVVTWAGPSGGGAHEAARLFGAEEIHLRILPPGESLAQALPEMESGPLAPL
ncbi:hypothetical protein MWN34_13070 [Ancylobacter sp. 6x-1]|uniref:Uncharacterized protein n=1 Tax=Ancylobacter crimeensis TaxID=2579147 RepID=A0ABT0DD91_9HYPH|nr:hypothetical protein [Ancylobacter crimeensis]MCK0197839.1 hypothetical protein [Ancylobacter crimeensis]